MQPLKFLKAFELTWPLRKPPSNWWMLLHGPYEKKILRIFFSENVVNKACGVAVVFALEGFSELWNCASMICWLPVGSNKQRLTWQVKKTFKRVMSDTWFKNFVFVVAPKEIEARGQRARFVYQRALRDGAVSVQRSRILLIGQDRAGKTSLKKSLIGLPFNRNENSTEGIEVDPSIFQVHADEVKNWQPIDKS